MLLPDVSDISLTFIVRYFTFVSFMYPSHILNSDQLLHQFIDFKAVRYGLF